jgi:hypothetical protein
MRITVHDSGAGASRQTVPAPPTWKSDTVSAGVRPRACYNTAATTGVVDNPADVQAAVDELSRGFARLVLRSYGHQPTVGAKKGRDPRHHSAVTAPSIQSLNVAQYHSGGTGHVV